MASISNFFENIKSKIGSNGRNTPPSESHGVDVYVNVYNMLALNKYISVFKAGVYHTGVEVHHIEYCFGGHPYDNSGIFPMVPKHAEHLGENYTLKASIKVGCTDFSEEDVKSIIDGLGVDFKGNQYHLLEKNCNHFSQAFVEILCGATLPNWINRLATITSNVSFIKNNIPPQLLTPQMLMLEDGSFGSHDDEEDEISEVVERPVPIISSMSRLSLFRKNSDSHANGSAKNSNGFIPRRSFSLKTPPKSPSKEGESSSSSPTTAKKSDQQSEELS